MAFDFLGTFTIDQLNDLELFLNNKIEEIDDQASNLIIEANKAKNLQEKYERALKNLGGLQNTNGLLITKRLEKIEESTANWVNQVYENQLFESTFLKKPNFSPSALDDIPTAVLMSKLKKPFIAEIKFQRERLEHKIRKCGDLVEQLEEKRFYKLIAKKETQALLEPVKEISAANEATKTPTDIAT